MEKIFVMFMVLILSAGFSFAQEKQPNNFEDWSEKPPTVIPGEKNTPPSDAIVLFANQLDHWEFKDGKPVTWPASGKGFKVVPGTPDIITKQAFGDCQLHVEWRVPKGEDQGKTLNWGNSGIKFMERYELQIYDSFNDAHKIYYNGQAGSIYKQHKPLVNCTKAAGEWQSYDVVFNAPVFAVDGSVEKPAYFTVFQNGILIQNHVEVRGTTSHTKFTEYQKHSAKEPLLIQSHGSAVEYRNIWIREL